MNTLTAEQRDHVAAFMATHDIPGVAVSLVTDGVPGPGEGFGFADLNTGRPFGADTLFPVASLTKSFTCVLAMQLRDQGRVDLDRPVVEYLPRLEVCDEVFTRGLTLRRLLSHQGGLGRTGHQDRTREEVPNPFPDRPSLVFSLGDAVPQSPPGTAFSYSNEGYAIAGHVLETLAGASLEDCFTARIYAPAGMQRSRVHFARWREEVDRALPYGGDGLGPFDSGERHGDFTVVRLVDDYQTFLATGGVVSTARDLARYQAATMNYVDSPLGISAGGLDHMHSVQAPFGDTGWGYGLGYWVMWSEGRKVIGHSGGLPGVSTYSMMMPGEGAGAVVLCNRSDVKAMVLAERLLGTLVGSLWRDDPGEPLPLSTKFSLDDAALSEYVGEYAFRKGPARVEAAGRGLLELTTPSRYDGPDQTVVLLPVAPDRFLDRKLGQCVPFYRDAAGRVSGFGFSGYGYDRRSSR
jgi:CubicO group peptidase (beta-lactamase class C family)